MSSFSDLTDVYLAVDGTAPLSEALIARVAEACERIEEHAEKELTLLVHLDGPAAGEGAGGAAEPWPHETGVHLVSRWERALRRLERLPSVGLAVAGGVVRGPAFDLLLATDYRMAATDLRLELASVGGGAWPGMALYRLVAQVGVAAARRMVLLGAPVAAERALAMGLVDEVTDDAPARVRAALPLLGGRPGREFAVRRQLLFEASTTSFEDALGTHLAACDRALRLARRGADVAPPVG